MKIQILNTEGEKKGETEVEIFNKKIREDIIQRVVESEKQKHPYAPFPLAGKQASASGKIRHARRKWKSAAGRGISRIPRKIFWRRGTQFYWQGATISGTRGGRRAHPPKILSMIKIKKINKKERHLAFLSALALTASIDEIKKKYKTLENKEINIKLPLVIDGKILELKTKEFFSVLKKILGPVLDISIQKKSIRAGKGKMRGRKYKKTAGLLFVIGKNEEKKIKGIEVKKAEEISVSDLASNGARFTAYTEEAVKELEEKLTGKKVAEKPVEKKKVKKEKRKARKEKRKLRKKKKTKPKIKKEIKERKK